MKGKNVEKVLKKETKTLEQKQCEEELVRSVEEDFNKRAKTYAEEIVKQEMIIYSIAAKEELTVTDEEYDVYLQTMLQSSGFADEKAFETYTGMPLEEYAETYRLDRDLLLTKELDTIYDRLVDKK